MLGFLLFATAVSVVAMLMLYLVVGQEPSVPNRATLVLRPAGDIPEILPDVILGGDQLTVRHYVEAIRKARHFLPSNAFPP